MPLTAWLLNHQSGRQAIMHLSMRRRCRPWFECAAASDTLERAFSVDQLDSIHRVDMAQWGLFTAVFELTVTRTIARSVPLNGLLTFFGESDTARDRWKAWPLALGEFD